MPSTMCVCVSFEATLCPKSIKDVQYYLMPDLINANVQLTKKNDQQSPRAKI